MPGPKFAVVDPAGNVVLEGTIVTRRFTLCAPLAGVSVKLGGPVSVMASELVNVNPAPEAVTVYTPPGLDGAKKLIDRPTLVPVTTLATVMGDPPPWGVSVTDTEGAETPAVKPLAVMLIGAFGLAVLGSILMRVIFCAYKGVKPRAVSSKVTNITPRFPRITGRKQGRVVSKILPGLRLSEISYAKYCRIIAFPYYSLQGISYVDKEYPCVGDRNSGCRYPRLRLVCSKV
jgi:hypothetical protein